MKITLDLDPTTYQVFEALDEQKKISLTEIVKFFLMSSTKKAEISPYKTLPEDIAPSILSLMGCIPPTNDDEKTARYEAIYQKYLKNLQQ